MIDVKTIFNSKNLAENYYKMKPSSLKKKYVNEFILKITNFSKIIRFHFYLLTVS